MKFRVHLDVNYAREKGYSSPTRTNTEVEADGASEGQSGSLTLWRFDGTAKVPVQGFADGTWAQWGVID